jgi:hypothetical protein
LKESVSLSKIEKSNMKLEKVLTKMKKFRLLMQENFSKVIQTFKAVTNHENSLMITFGQLTALATTPIGQALGMPQMLFREELEKNKHVLEEM